jgi:hypothetical protein
MSAEQVIAEIEALAPAERERVMEYLHRLEEAEIPESFRRGMAQARSGQGFDMETALHERPTHDLYQR